MSGWIKLHKTLKDWEWYDDHNATRLLVHLLVSVNYKDKEWKGQTIKAGTYVTSWENLAKEIGLSVKQTRVAMDKLERSKEVARYATNKWQAITLVKWDKLQCEDVDNGKQQGKQRATTKAFLDKCQTSTARQNWKKSIKVSKRWRSARDRWSEKRLKTIQQYSLKGELIEEWKQAKLAAAYVGTSIVNIRGCLIGRQKTAGGYIWKYKSML